MKPRGTKLWEGDIYNNKVEVIKYIRDKIL